MTTVRELINYLENIPSDTELRVVVMNDEGYYQRYNYEPMDLSEELANVTFIDLSGNQFVKPGDTNYGKRFLDFGEA